jgi:ribosomal protein L12E/L44/L45/RPP1/RPP2
MVQDQVRLFPEEHRYFDKEGNEYMSVSKLLGKVQAKFDSERISMAVATREGKEQEEILGEWKGKQVAAAEHGTRIHNALDAYQTRMEIRKEDEDLEASIKAITGMYSEYNKVMSEVCLYDKEYRVAGTCDRLLFNSNRKDCSVDIDDFKTNLSKGIYYVGYKNKWLLEPFTHLQDCNYVTYSLQLSCYAYMWERMTGRKVRKLGIVFIPPEDPLAFKRIPVPYMKMEVERLMEINKDWHRECPKEEVITETPNFI